LFAFSFLHWEKLSLVFTQLLRLELRSLQHPSKAKIEFPQGSVHDTATATSKNERTNTIFFISFSFLIAAKVTRGKIFSGLVHVWSLPPPFGLRNKSSKIPKPLGEESPQFGDMELMKISYFS